MSVVLVVEDERGVREGLGRALEKSGHDPRLVESIEAARQRLALGGIDCILLDIRLKDGDGLSLLREIRRGPQRDVPVVVATAYGDSERTIQAMRDGAFEYLTKPFDLPQLLATVDRALKHVALARAAGQREPAPSVRGPLVGTSAAMLDVWKVIGRAAGSSAPVLVLGESGTGKELVARAIHDYSSRAKLPFVAVSLAALPAAAIETETVRRMESAAGGTLFLDDVADLDAAAQAKLLAAIAREKARIVSAANKPVRPGQQASTMREELYYRLAVIEIELPPLRARRSDIPLLVAHALEGTPARAVSEDAMAHLLAYPWPGNVRELLHVVKRAAVMGGSEVIDAHDLPSVVRAPPDAKSPPGDGYESMPLRDAVAALEKRLLLHALASAGGNRAEAARRLGIARPQLYAKMEEHGIATRADRSTS